MFFWLYAFGPGWYHKRLLKRWAETTFPHEANGLFSVLAMASGFPSFVGPMAAAELLERAELQTTKNTSPSYARKIEAILEGPYPSEVRKRRKSAIAAFGIFAFCFLAFLPMAVFPDELGIRVLFSIICLILFPFLFSSIFLTIFPRWGDITIERDSLWFRAFGMRHKISFKHIWGIRPIPLGALFHVSVKHKFPLFKWPSFLRTGRFVGYELASEDLTAALKILQDRNRNSRD